MLDVTTILQTLAALLFSAALAFVSNRVSKVLDNQTAQVAVSAELKTSVEVIKTSLNLLTTQVTSLAEWRNKEMERNAEIARETIKNLQSQLDILHKN